MANHPGASNWLLYRKLTAELRRRTIEPVAHPSFVAYFLVAIVGFGGLGVWLELYRYIYAAQPAPPLDGLRVAINTFYPTLAGAASLQLLWAENDKKELRSVAVLLFVLFIAIALWVSPPVIENKPAIITGSLVSIAALWCWWIANADAHDFHDTNPDAAVGAERGSEPLRGGLDEYEH